MLMAARLIASLLTSTEGGVRLCVAVPNIDLLPCLEVAKDHPRSSLEEAADSGDWRNGRKELWPSPQARAEHPTKPGLTPAWGERGKDGSSPITSSWCHVTSLLATAALGWAKLGPLCGAVWPQTGWGLCATCCPCITPGSPRVALKVWYFEGSLCLQHGQRWVLLPLCLFL